MEERKYKSLFDLNINNFDNLCGNIISEIYDEKPLKEIAILEFSKFILRVINKNSENVILPDKFIVLSDYIVDYVDNIGPMVGEYSRISSYLRIYQLCKLLTIQECMHKLDMSIEKGLMLNSEYLDILKVISSRPLIAYKNLLNYCDYKENVLREGLVALEQDKYIYVKRKGVGQKRFFEVTYRGRLLLKSANLEP